MPAKTGIQTVFPEKLDSRLRACEGIAFFGCEAVVMREPAWLGVKIQALDRGERAPE